VQIVPIGRSSWRRGWTPPGDRRPGLHRRDDAPNGLRPVAELMDSEVVLLVWSDLSSAQEAVADDLRADGERSPRDKRLMLNAPDGSLDEVIGLLPGLDGRPCTARPHRHACARGRRPPPGGRAAERAHRGPAPSRLIENLVP
jgi:hypothetical protein